MVGQRLHQYVVLEKAGAGGMGVVWKARDTRLDRFVALKVLPADHRLDASLAERFLREAKAASALNHPNIITIYEINSDQGIDYIAMEYVSGETLAQRLTRGRPSLTEANEIATQIADALGRAHRAGIVHRDLKPGNVMIGEDGVVKVLDFGLAKITATTDESGLEPTVAVLTEVGMRLGTVGYMSPEQAVGDPVDARSDVFSFGVMLYELITGSLPFAGRTRSETLRKLHSEDPPALDVLRSEAPAWLLEIVTKCLAKAPEGRFPDMGAVRQAFAAAKPTSSRSQRPGSTGRGQTLRLVVAAAVLIGIGAAGTIAIRNGWSPDWWSTPSPPPQSGPAATAQELTAEAATLLTRQDREENVDRAIAALEGALQRDSQHAPAHALLSEAYLRKQRTNPDPQWRRLAEESARRALALNPDLAIAHLAAGFVDLDLSRPEPAAAAFKRAADLDPMNALPHLGMGLYHVTQKRDDEAEAAFRRAVALGSGDWRTHAELGSFLYRRARYDDAIAAFEQARQVTPDNVIVLRNLGPVYYLAGRFDEAASALQRALEIRPVPPIYANLGTVRFFQGRYSDAVVAFEKAVEGAANNYLYWGNLADAYRWAPGRRDDAPAAYQRARELLASDLAKRPDDAELRTRQALYLAKGGDPRGAASEVTTLATRTDLTPQMLFRIVVVKELTGDRTGALDALRRALAAGYPVSEIAQEPELVALRADARYHRLVVDQGRAGRR